MFKGHFYLNDLLKVTDDFEKRSQISQILIICFDSNIVFQCWRMDFLFSPRFLLYSMDPEVWSFLWRANTLKEQKEHNQKTHTLCWPTTILLSSGHSEGSCQNYWANRNKMSSLCSLFSHESEWQGIISSFLITAAFSYDIQKLWLFSPKKMWYLEINMRSTYYQTTRAFL